VLQQSLQRGAEAGAVCKSGSTPGSSLVSGPGLSEQTGRGSKVRTPARKVVSCCCLGLRPLFGRESQRLRDLGPGLFTTGYGLPRQPAGPVKYQNLSVSIEALALLAGS
jgi:hypothetical protein